jgi:hypothetical protein
MLILVSQIHPPPYGKKMAHINAENGQVFEVWPDKLAGVEIGKSYEVETREREFNGRTIRSIEKISPAKNTATPAPIPNSQASPYPGGAEFVGRTIAALIIRGEIGASQVAKTTARLRQIWRDSDSENGEKS